MTTPLRLAALLLALPAAALAQDSVLDQPVEKEGWPIEATHRPLTLAAGMLEIAVPLDVGLSRGDAGKPVTLAPSLRYGVTSALTVGLRHAAGICLSGSGDCPRGDTYQDVGVEALYSLWRGVSTDLAAGVALDASPVSSPTAISAEVKLVYRLRAGPVALTLAPALEVGLSERDTVLGRTRPISFPLATYGFGFFEGALGNKEFLRVPVSLAWQVRPPVVLAVGASLDGELSPPGVPGLGSPGFGDVYRIPLGAALAYSPSNMLDLGVSFTFLNLLGKDALIRSGGDERAAQAFVAFRM